MALSEKKTSHGTGGGDKKKKNDSSHASGKNKGAAEVGREEGRKTKKSTKEKRRPSKKSSADKSIAVSDEGDQGTWKAAINRHSLREDVMLQVLEDFRAKPVVETEKPVKSRVWPFFRLRRTLGLAHISLHDAVLDGNVEKVKSTLLRYIRKYPAKINEHDEEGRTALSLAILEQREDIADLILSVDETDVNNPDTLTGLSPLHNAVLLELGSSAQKLAFRGANINAADKVGMTPLMLACRLGHGSMVEMLVDVFGTELDPADRAGWTCLFYATYHGEANVVQFLLIRGANPDHKDSRGMTPLDWGEHMGLGEVCSVFERFEPQLVS